MESIREFLEREMEKSGWKQADLARASNLDSAVISNIINGKRKMGEETGRAIARAFKLPPTVVFRAAGILPYEPEYVPLLDEWNAVFFELTPDEQQELIDIARMKIDRRKQPEKVFKKQASRRGTPARSAVIEE